MLLSGKYLMLSCTHRFCLVQKTAFKRGATFGVSAFPEDIGLNVRLCLYNNTVKQAYITKTKLQYRINLIVKIKTMNVGENHIERKKSIAEKHAFLSLYIYFLFRSVVFSISFLYYETANLALITGHHATTIHNNSKRQTSLYPFQIVLFT